MATRALTPSLPLRRIAAPRWSAPAWGAIGITTGFIALTCWWLSQDSTVPIYDAGLHLILAIHVYQQLGSGEIGHALTSSYPYPPFAYLIGALGIRIGGLGVAPPIIAENLVFVTLLALGCYNVARLAFGSLAGLLAVVFAFGSPLISAQFRVFMTDAPETAMVAVSVWLVLATRGFTQLRTCAIAGVAVGLAAMTKEPAPSFIVGPIAVVLLRDLRSSWRGFAIFAAVAIAIALPWYIDEFHQILEIGTEATSAASNYNNYYIPDVAPGRLSFENLTWYLWSFINSQLLLPLVLFAGAGFVWALVGFVRKRPVSSLALELTVGAFVGWLVITQTFIHDTRYSMPLELYAAVFAAGWVAHFAGKRRAIAVAALSLVALANTLGIAFGVGGTAKVTLPGAVKVSLQGPGTLTLFENQGFLVSQPRRDGDFPELLQALKRYGVRTLNWNPARTQEPEFSEAGISALVMIAGLEPQGAPAAAEATRSNAFVAYETLASNQPRPCITLDNHHGVWVVLGNPKAPKAQYFCPLPKPHFYN